MATKRDWRKTRRTHGSEPANPNREAVPGPHTHVKRAPVKRWADMLEEEQRIVRAEPGLCRSKDGEVMGYGYDILEIEQAAAAKVASRRMEELTQSHVSAAARVVRETLARFVGQGCDVAVVWDTGLSQTGVVLNVGFIAVTPGQPVALPPGCKPAQVTVYAVSKVQGPAVPEGFYSSEG